jgi:polar amino acid transport system ATP-binding protein
MSSLSGADDAVSSVARTPRVAIEDLTKYYGQTLVLDEVFLDIYEHEVISLIGASGSGKSTLIRCINQLVPFDHGAIRLDGVDIEDPSFGTNGLRKRIGIVFQAFNLFPHMNVLDNITLAPRRVHGVARDQAEHEARELLGRLEMANFAGAYPEQLSGGLAYGNPVTRSKALQGAALNVDFIGVDPEMASRQPAVSAGAQKQVSAHSSAQCSA